MNEDNGPPGDESAESCPELDDNYFQDLGKLICFDYIFCRLKFISYFIFYFREYGSGGLLV